MEDVQNVTNFTRKEFWIFFQTDYSYLRELPEFKHLLDLPQMAE